MAAFLKHGSEVINKIQQSVGVIREKGRIPEEWKQSIVCPIHKKEDKLNCQNSEASCYFVQATKLSPTF
jgi:hypothetical protein